MARKDCDDGFPDANKTSEVKLTHQLYSLQAVNVKTRQCNGIYVFDRKQSQNVASLMPLGGLANYRPITALGHGGRDFPPTVFVLSVL